MKTMIFVEDNVVPQLFTTAIEAYEFEHKASLRGKGYDKLETFGLLWGYVIPAKGDEPAKVVATMATVETSAVRHEDWVSPEFDSIRAKKEFFTKYWPNVELIGTFHSHPYSSLDEVNEAKGWRASKLENEFDDLDFWSAFHEEISPEQPFLAHLVVTIAKLQKTGWAYPSRLSGSEEKSGYVLSADNRKIWMRGYASVAFEDGEEIVFDCDKDVLLDIPALQRRFMGESYL